MHRETALFLKALPVATAAIVLADAATADAAKLVTNPDFAGTYVYPGTFGGGSVAVGWTGSSDTGISTFQLGKVWDNGNVPGRGISGNAGFMANNGEEYTDISTIVSGLIVGDEYALSFYANPRAYSGTANPATRATIPCRSKCRSAARACSTTPRFPTSTREVSPPIRSSSSQWTSPRPPRPKA